MDRVNLLMGFLVRDIPKLARDYLYRAFYPIARRRGLFVVEYPSLFKEWCVCWVTCVWEEGGERMEQQDDDGMYSARAPMSRNEGDEEEELLVWMVFVYLKAYSLFRVTVVREGMPVCEVRVIRHTLQSDRTRMLECMTVFSFSSEGCEFG